MHGRGSGTLCRMNCNNVALSDNLNGVWKFGSWDYGGSWLFVKQRRIEIVLLTYLLCEKVSFQAAFQYNINLRLQEPSKEKILY